MDMKEPLLIEENKSIQWDVIKQNISVYDVPADCIKVPIGVTDYGKVEYVILESTDKLQHIFITGQPCSGKSCYVNWILSSLSFAYGNSVVINYVTGRGNELYKYLRNDYSPKFFNSGVVKIATTINDLRSTLKAIISRINLKDSKVPEVVAIDSVSYLVPRFSTVDKESLKFILEEGPKKNVHVILTDSSYPLIENAIECSGNLLDWSAICATKVYVSAAVYLQGSIMACSNTRNYGDIVVKHDGNLKLLRVPELSDEETDELFH